MADPLLLPLFSQSVQFFSQSAVDNYGRRSFGSVAASFNARIQEDESLVRDAQGRQVVSVGTIYLYETSPVINTDFRCVLPDGTEPIIITADLVADEIGSNHQRIRIGKS
jgi:hypothetical protein